MKKYYLLGLLLLSSIAWLKAQDSTSIISSDRPLGEMASIVTHKSLQLETGFGYEKTNTKFSTTQGLGLNSTLLRYGIGEKVELRFDFSVWQNRSRYRESSVSSEIVETGLRPIRFGMKANLIENKGALPAVSFVGMLGFPQVATDVFQPQYISPDLQLAFSNAVGKWLSLCYNLGVRWDGNNPSPTNYYALATKFHFSSKFGAFLQGRGTFQRTSLPAGAVAYTHNTFARAGLMFVPKPNIQIDLSGGVRVSEYDQEWTYYNSERNNSFAAVGLSWRFPR